MIKMLYNFGKKNLTYLLCTKTNKLAISLLLLIVLVNEEVAICLTPFTRFAHIENRFIFPREN